MKNRVLAWLLVFLIISPICISLLYINIIKPQLIAQITQEQLSRLHKEAESLSVIISHQDIEAIRNWVSLTSELPTISKLYVLSDNKNIIASNNIVNESTALFESDIDAFNKLAKLTGSAEHIELQGSELIIAVPIFVIGTNTVSHYLYMQENFSAKFDTLLTSYISAMLATLLLVLTFALSLWFMSYRYYKNRITSICANIAKVDFSADSETIAESTNDSLLYPLECAINNALQLSHHFIEHRQQECDYFYLIKESVTDAIITTNNVGVITSINSAGVAMFGYDNENDLLGKSVMMLIPSHYHGIHNYSFSTTVKEGHANLGNNVLNKLRQLHALKKDGSEFPVEIVLTQTLVQNQQVYTAIIKDFSTEQNYRQSVERIAFFDELTTLSNFSGFKREVMQFHGSLKLSLLELTALKGINDSYGYSVGDEFIKSFAFILAQIPLENMIVCRLQSGRFLVACTSNGREMAAAFKNLANTEIKLADTTIKPHFYRCVASVQNSADVEYTLRQCEVALRKARDKGVGSVVVLDVAYIEQLKATAILAQQLEKAIDNKAFHFDYQPKFDCKTGRITSAEALIRWQLNGSLVSPGDFIPLAEQRNLMPKIDLLVIKSACMQIRKWLDMGLTLVPISINLSARNLIESETIRYIFENLGEYDVPATLLEIEVTEYGLIKDFKKTALNMARLHRAGVDVAIDDYGTGHSNLETVLSLPIKHLKIDQSFIRLGMKTEKGKAILENIISLAASLKVKTTAEGVETQEQLEYLRESNCNDVQGYLLSKPLGKKEFEAFLVKQTIP